MSKRIIVLLFCVLLCFGLTGCGLKYLNPFAWPGLIEDASKELQDTSDRNSLKNTIAKNSTYPQSQATSNAAKEATKWSDKSIAKSAYCEEHPVLSRLWPPFYTDHMRAMHAESKAIQTENAYYSAVASDNTLQSAIKQAEGKTRVKGFSFGDIPTLVIFIAIAFVVLLLLAILKNMKAKRKAIRKGLYADTEAVEIQAKAEIAVAEAQVQVLEAQAKIAQQQPVSQLQLTAVPEKKQVGTYDGQMALLQRQCKKRGLNPDVIMAKCGNDPFKANELILSTPPEQLATMQ